MATQIKLLIFFFYSLPPQTEIHSIFKQTRIYTPKCGASLQIRWPSHEPLRYDQTEGRGPKVPVLEMILKSVNSVDTNSTSQREERP